MALQVKVLRVGKEESEGGGGGGDEASATKKDASKEKYPCAPILARFPNEKPSTVLDKVQLYASKDHLQRKDCYVVAKTTKENGGVQYVGSTLNSNLMHPAKYVVGLLDRKKKTLSLVEPTHHASVMQLKVYRPPQGKGKNGEKKEGEEEEEAEDYMSQRRNLLKQFGSSKIKKLISKRERTAVKDSSNLFSMDQDEMIQWAKRKGAENIERGQSEQEQVLQMTSVRRSLLPPHHLGAQTPEEAYPLDEFVNQECWQCLKDVEAVAEMLRGEMTNCCPYLQRQYADTFPNGNLDGEVDAKSKVVKAMCVYEVLKWVYVNYRRDIKCEGPGIEPLATALSLPSVFVQKVVAKFFKEQNNIGKNVRWECSKQDRISLQIHLLLLMLIIEKYSSSSKAMAEELDVPEQEVKTLARQLGCDVAFDKVNLLRSRTKKRPALESKLPEIKLKKIRTR